MRRAFTCLVALALLAATPAIASADTWPQYRHDSAASGVNLDQPTIQANRWRVRWSKNADETRLITGHPLIGEDAVYVAGYKLEDGMRVQVQVWSFDFQTGRLNWVKRIPCGGIGPLVLVDGIVVVWIIRDLTLCPVQNDVDYNGRTWFIDAESGDKEVNGYAQFGASILYDDIPSTVSIPGPLGRLYMWWFEEARFNTVPFQGALPTGYRFSGLGQPLRVLNDEVWLMRDGTRAPRPPVVSDGVALIPANTSVQGLPVEDPYLPNQVPPPPVIHWGQCGTVACAVDINTHEVLWTDAIAGTDPLVHDGVVYGACPTGLCGLDLRTGVELWSVATPTAASPIMAGGVLWVPTATDPVTTRGYDPATGALVSRRPFTQELGPAGGAAAIANGWMVTRTAGGIKAVTFDR